MTRLEQAPALAPAGCGRRPAGAAPAGRRTRRRRRQGDEIEGEQDVEQRVARHCAACCRPTRSSPRAAIATTRERDEDAERRQQSGAATRATLHRRVRRPAVEERLQRPAVMGIVNVTPDSFSDGGVHLDPDAAAAAARRMVDDGAAIVDVGGESTRPGSDGVSLDEELRRVIPVLERLEGLPVSIDTAKSEVARRALALGAELVNDVTALRGDPELAGVVADGGAYLCLMHMQRRAADDAGRPALRRRRGGGRRLPRGAAGVRRLGRDPGGARLPRSGHRLRQDGGAELRAGPAPRRPARARPPRARRALAQELAREALRSGGAHRHARGLARRGRGRLRARRVDLPRPRRSRARRGA